MISEVFKDLEVSKVHYTLFSGNISLQRAFEGRGDFDVLIEDADLPQLIELLARHGFVERKFNQGEVDERVHNYINYDPEEEKVFHFHIHTKAFIDSGGEFHFDNTEWWIKQGLPEERHGIRLVNPTFEFALAVLNFSYTELTKTMRRKVKNAIKSKHVSKQLSKVNSLARIIDMETFESLENTVFARVKTEIIDVYESVYHNRPILKSTIESLNIFLEDYRYSDSKQFKPRGRQVRSVCNSRRIITLLGVDGAGKSSMSDEVTVWLNYKLSAERVFLGQVKGLTLNWILRKTSRLFRSIGIIRVANIAKDYTHIINARHRRGSIKLAKNLTSRGITVITDRYPLKEFWSMKRPMDGPKLKPSSFLSESEKAIYESFPNYPDLIIYLRIPLEVSISRKPEEHNNDTRIAGLKNKIDALESLPQLKNLIVVDATRPYEEVRKEIKSIVWHYITNRPLNRYVES